MKNMNTLSEAQHFQASRVKPYNQQHRATPCEHVVHKTEALKGRNQTHLDVAPSGLGILRNRFAGRCPTLLMLGVALRAVFDRPTRTDALQTTLTERKNNL